MFTCCACCCANVICVVVCLLVVCLFLHVVCLHVVVHVVIVCLLCCLFLWYVCMAQTDTDLPDSSEDAFGKSSAQRACHMTPSAMSVCCLKGQLPKKELLKKYNLLQFSDVSQAVRCVCVCVCDTAWLCLCPVLNYMMVTDNGCYHVVKATSSCCHKFSRLTRPSSSTIAST